MDFRKEKSSLENFKETDIVNFLYELGFQPARIRATIIGTAHHCGMSGLLLSK